MRRWLQAVKITFCLRKSSLDIPIKIGGTNNDIIINLLKAQDRLFKVCTSKMAIGLGSKFEFVNTYLSQDRWVRVGESVPVVEARHGFDSW